MIKQLKPKAKTVKDLDLDSENMKKAALVLRAYNHKLRQKIMAFIHKNGQNSVSEIYGKLKLEQSVTSQHLALLRKAGFVKTQREGQNIFYSLNYERLKQVEGFAKAIVG